MVEVLSARNTSVFSQENHRNPVPFGTLSGFMRYLKACGTLLQYEIGPQRSCNFKAVSKLLFILSCCAQLRHLKWCVGHSALKKVTVVKWYRVVDFKAHHLWVGQVFNISRG